MRLEDMMHRNISVIMLIMASLFAKAQNFQTITRVVYEQQRISGYNSLNKLAVQVDCKDMVWQVLPDNSIKIWDDIHSFTVFSTTLTVPAFAALGDSLRAWQVSCGQSSTPFPTNLDTTHIDTSLIVPTMIENFSNRNNDTLSAILAAIAAHKDTSNYYILDSINYRLSLLDKSDIDTSLVLPDILAKFATKNNDTLSAILLALNNLTPNDTSNFWIFDSIYQELKAVDTLCFTGEIAVKDSLLRTTVLQGTVNSTNSNTAIVVSERPQVAQFGAVADLVTSHTTSSVIPTASTLEVIVENIGTSSTTITYQGVNMPLDVKQQRVFHAIWDEARRIYSPIGTLVVNGTASATIVVIIKNPQ